MQNKFWIVWLATILFFFTGCDKTSDSNPAPLQLTITSVYPATAKGGETITIKGQNLLIDGQINKVLVNKSEASIISSSNDSIIAVVPQRAGSGTVSVVTNTKTYTGSSFTYQYIVQVSTIAGTGNQGNNDGPALSATFKYPWGITVDNNGDIYIADSYNRLIRKIDGTTKIVSSMSPGTLNFYSPYNITIDTISESLYVTDFNAHLLKINSSGSMSVIFTDAGNGPLAGIGLGPDKRLYVSNNTTGEVLRFDTTGLNRSVFSVGLTTPRNIIFDKDGKMYVSGGGIYKMEANGNFSQVMPVSSRLRGWEIAMDSLGNFYEADYPNNCIRKIDKNGNAIIIAGNGIAADIDGIGLGASFNGPTGIAIDKEGNLYVTTHNFTTGAGNKVRKLTFY
jgi:IPT/TIG domain/NHL repeat